MPERMSPGNQEDIPGAIIDFVSAGYAGHQQVGHQLAGEDTDSIATVAPHPHAEFEILLVHDQLLVKETYLVEDLPSVKSGSYGDIIHWADSLKIVGEVECGSVPGSPPGEPVISVLIDYHT